jgi:hypothetical protein
VKATRARDETALRTVCPAAKDRVLGNSVRAVLFAALATMLSLGGAGCQSCLDEPGSQGQAAPASTDRTQGPVKIRPGMVRVPVQAATRDAGDVDD